MFISSDRFNLNRWIAFIGEPTLKWKEKKKRNEFSKYRWMFWNIWAVGRRNRKDKIMRSKAFYKPF